MKARREHQGAAGADPDGTAHADTGRRGRTTDGRAFLSISAAARMLGVSTATLYRAINEGQFPAVRIRDRVIVPTKAIEALTDDAIEGCHGEGPGYVGGLR